MNSRHGRPCSTAVRVREMGCGAADCLYCWLSLCKVVITGLDLAWPGDPRLPRVHPV